jgi:hypothetical protein
VSRGREPLEHSTWRMMIYVARSASLSPAWYCKTCKYLCSFYKVEVLESLVEEQNLHTLISVNSEIPKQKTKHRKLNVKTANFYDFLLS